MKFGIATIVLAAAGANAAFFAPTSSRQAFSTTTALKGYLDDLSKDLYSVADNPDIEGSTKEATDLPKEKVDRFSPGDWSSYVEFDEFDGGDGQMGVAGDGKKVRIVRRCVRITRGCHPSPPPPNAKL
jgi:hypothetical protein